MTIIPVDVVLQLRGALLHRLGSIAEDIASACREPDHGNPDEWSRPIAHFDATRALLDRIGWNARNPESDIAISERHLPALTATLSADLDSERSLMEEEGNEEQRESACARALKIEAFAEHAGLDLNADGERRITIPDDFIDLLIEALLSDFRDAAQSVENAGLDPDAYPDPLEHFDSIRALLNALSWGEHTDIDLDAHHGVLQTTLTERLEMERGFMADASTSRTAEGAKRQYDHAHGYALQLEAFMRRAELEIPEAGEQDA
jgi:hypothetical protein